MPMSPALSERPIASVTYRRDVALPSDAIDRHIGDTFAARDRLRPSPLGGRRRLSAPVHTAPAARFLRRERDRTDMNHDVEMPMGTLYVIGESAEVGPVKIGMTFGAGGKVGRGGLSGGNWRQLVPLGQIAVDNTTVRWREWLTHHRLRNVHVRGEWFDARALAGDDWHRFLDGVWHGTTDGLHEVPLGIANHKIVTVRQPTPPQRHFWIECSCGDLIDGQPDTALPSALVAYALQHLDLQRDNPIVGELRIEPSQARFNLHPYQQP